MLLWATEATTLSVLLLATWLHDRTMREIGLWGAAFGCHGVGVALIGLRGHIPDVMSIHFGNALQLGGISLWCAGLLVYDGKKPQLWLMAPPLIWLGGLLVLSIRDQFWARTVLAQSTSAITYGVFGTLLILGRRKPRGVRIVFACVAAFQSFLMFKMALQSLEVRPTKFTEMPGFVAYAMGNIFCLVSGILLGTRLLMARTEERLRHLALTDPLTGVLNRRGFIDSFHDMQRSSTASQPMLALVLFDLDHFKQINDRYGHTAGDAVLTAFCRLAALKIGQGGVFGRMGGEEFACVVHVANAAQAIAVAESLRAALAAREIDFGTVILRATVSAGIAIESAQKSNLDDMLISADKALYASKEAGRNQTSIWNDRASMPADKVDTAIAGLQSAGA
jgi:diguanylate cyclase (GGDEF)-like protein